MKKTGKTLTLSGQLPKRQFQELFNREPHTILEYANVLDLNRAWKVRDFRCWLSQTPAEMGITKTVVIGLEVQLSSDSIPNPPDWNNAGDNRGVGWGTLSYYIAQSNVKPDTPLGGHAKLLMNSEYWMMEDHVIQNKLTISAQAPGSSDLEAAGGYILNYIVNLEEIVITPTESIIFNIKSQAQDLSN